MDGDQQRLLATMPLHAITSTYGEEGLRARFAAEIEAWPEADQRRLNQAGDALNRRMKGIIYASGRHRHDINDG